MFLSRLCPLARLLDNCDHLISLLFNLLFLTLFFRLSFNSRDSLDMIRLGCGELADDRVASPRYLTQHHHICVFHHIISDKVTRRGAWPEKSWEFGSRGRDQVLFGGSSVFFEVQREYQSDWVLLEGARFVWGGLRACRGREDHTR